MGRAIGYIRVSTSEQATEGVSLEAQEQRIRAYASHARLELVRIEVDAGVSAGKALEKRPAGERVLTALRRKEATAVIALKLDRLFRKAGDCLDVTETWERQGVGLHLVDFGGMTLDTSSPMGKFFITMMSAFAELERETLRERTRTAMRHLRREGRVFNHPPLGWKVAEGRLEALPREQEAVALIQALHRRGKSLRAIADELKASGHRTKRGGGWHASTVRAVLRRAA